MSALFNSLGIQHSSYDMVPDPYQVLDPASSYHDHGVFLKIVAFARNVASDFCTIGQANAGDLAQSGVRFLWSGGRDLDAYASFERRWIRDGLVLDGVEAIRKSPCLVLAGNAFPVFSYELAYGRHYIKTSLSATHYFIRE